MGKLYFRNPVFHTGQNVTVRRGIKWDVADKNNVLIIDARNPLNVDGHDEVLNVVDIETKVVKFNDISRDDLEMEHDPNCTTFEGLFNVMKDIYAGFEGNEIVTVVSFFVG